MTRCIRWAGIGITSAATAHQRSVREIVSTVDQQWDASWTLDELRRHVRRSERDRVAVFSIELCPATTICGLHRVEVDAEGVFGGQFEAHRPDRAYARARTVLLRGFALPLDEARDEKLLSPLLACDRFIRWMASNIDRASKVFASIVNNRPDVTIPPGLTAENSRESSVRYRFRCRRAW